MSWDFSLESSKIKWVILAFLLLLVMVFLAGYVSGVMTNATAPDSGAKKTTPMKTPKPNTTKTASVSKKADDKPNADQPQNGGVVTKAGDGSAPVSTPADASPAGGDAADAGGADAGGVDGGGVDGGAMEPAPVAGGDDATPMAGSDAPAPETADGSDPAPAPDADGSKTAEQTAEEPAAVAATGDAAPAEVGEKSGGDAKPAAGAKPGDAEDGNGKKDGNNGWTIQVGSFSLEMNAQDLKKKLKEKGMEVCILRLADHKDKWWYVVQVGEFKERAETKPVVEALKEERLVAIIKPITDTLLEQRTRCK